MTSKFPAHPERRPVVVTGASSGIGQATAEALAAAGHPVVIAARRLGELQGIATSIREDGGEAHAVHLDLADPESILRFVDAAHTAVGEVEVIVANAARNQVGSILETPPEELEGSGVRVSIVRPGPTLTEMGWDWDMTRTQAALDEWTRWGLVRHDSYMRPSAVAQAVAAVVAMPRGAQITSLEIHPEAPVREDD